MIINGIYKGEQPVLKEIINLKGPSFHAYTADITTTDWDFIMVVITNPGRGFANTTGNSRLNPSQLCHFMIKNNPTMYIGIPKISVVSNGWAAIETGISTTDTTITRGGFPDSTTWAQCFNTYCLNITAYIYKYI